ncbi:MAG: sulfotransferase [Gammaproteobacteria bacterium]|nr:sulfotransferase [Gammaproteobacteria bacterium]
MTKPDPATIKSLFDLYRAGEYRTLLERAESLLETWPDEPALHSLAGSACLEMQDYDSAIRRYRAALAIRPDLAKVHNSLGIACLQSGQLENAANSFHNAVKHDSQLAQAWFNLGIVYENRNRLAEAAGYYKQATLINPVYHQALCSLAKVLWELRIPDQVQDYFEKAVAIEENYLPAHMGLLRFLEQSNRHEKLRDAVSRARRILGEHDVVRLHEGILIDIDGEHERARSLLEAFSITPADVWTRHGERTRLARLAHLCDRLDDTAKAFLYAQKANDLSREISDSKGIDKSRFLQTVEKRRQYFTAGNINQWPNLTSGSGPSGDGLQVRPQSPVDPVFIIGFPRSGTTLLDTLLRGHPDIRLAEEADAVPALVNRLSRQSDERLETLANLRDRDVDDLRKTYFDALARHAKPDDSVLPIDRFALNTVYAGEIHRIFPEARFILLLRHPADCVLSCFMQTFYETPANASFFNLEDSAHLYDRVFGLWRQYTGVLQLNVLQVKYEDVVADAETTCGRILNFLDMPWHPGILEHQRTARERPLIGTASYNQVTRPLYTEAQGRWLRYRREMEPVLPVLEPWISYFEY